jgi:hypothetical protein
MASHDWQGFDGNNHKRVTRVVKALGRLGLGCWFDEEEMRGSLHEKMIEGIVNSEGFLVFVTKRYHDKVAGANDGDNCKFEFNLALKRKTVGKMLAVVLEKEMFNEKNWIGLMASLEPRLYFDLTDLDRLNDQELQIKLQKGMIPLMTWLTPDSYTESSGRCKYMH